MLIVREGHTVRLQQPDQAIEVCMHVTKHGVGSRSLHLRGGIRERIRCRVEEALGAKAQLLRPNAFYGKRPRNSDDARFDLRIIHQDFSCGVRGDARVDLLSFRTPCRPELQDSVRKGLRPIRIGVEGHLPQIPSAIVHIHDGRRSLLCVPRTI